jgi:hypothetical protein
LPETLGAGQVPSYGGENQGDKSGGRFSIINGWPGYTSAPSRLQDPTGKMANDGTVNFLFTEWTFGVESDGNGSWRVHGSVTLDMPFVDFGPGASFEIKPDKDGDPSVETESHGANEPAPVEPVPVGKTAEKGSEEPENEKDSQPAEEGSGGRGQRGWCSPTGGCLTVSVVPSLRIIPSEDYSTPTTRSQLPNWATDPCPDCTSRGGGSGYSGFTPQDEGDGGPDNPSNPI